MKVCNEPDCPNLQAESRCLAHRREREQARGSSQARGYDAEHKAARKAWAPRVATGTVRCRRCPDLIEPASPWDLGHPDADCPAPRAPEHESCNRATAGRRISPGA